MNRLISFLQDLNEFFRIIFKPRLAGLLYLRYRIETRGIIYASVLTGKLVYANNLTLRRLQRTHKELTSHPWLHFVHPDDRQATVEARKKVDEETGIGKFSNRYLRGDGSYIRLTWETVRVGHWYVCEVTFPNDIQSD